MEFHLYGMPFLEPAKSPNTANAATSACLYPNARMGAIYVTEWPRP